MSHIFQFLDSRVRWFLSASAFLLVCFPAVAQQAHLSAPLTANEVMSASRRRTNCATGLSKTIRVSALISLIAIV
jgi:uncharacterized membrane protein